MENITAACESFYDKSKEKEVHADLFNSFMRRIIIWDYSCITREHFLSLPNNEKEAMIKRYHKDMDDKTCDKILLFFIEVEVV